MQSTALPPLLTDLPADERARLLDDEALRHLPAVFAAVPDPRGRQGRRYPTRIKLRNEQGRSFGIIRV